MEHSRAVGRTWVCQPKTGHATTKFGSISTTSGRRWLNAHGVSPPQTRPLSSASSSPCSPCATHVTTCVPWLKSKQSCHIIHYCMFVSLFVRVHAMFRMSPSQPFQTKHEALHGKGQEDPSTHPITASPHVKTNGPDKVPRACSWARRETSDRPRQNKTAATCVQCVVSRVSCSIPFAQPCIQTTAGKESCWTNLPPSNQMKAWVFVLSSMCTMSIREILVVISSRTLKK